MKNSISKFTMPISSTLLLLAMMTGFTSAQSWNLAGNTGTNASTNFIGTTDNVAFKIRTKNLVRVTVTSSGSVGIGTSSPTSKLSVTGSANITGNLGIGTTTPAARLDVTGGEVHCNNPGQGFVHSDGVIQLATYLDGTGAWLGTNTTHSLLFYTNNSAAPSIAINPLGNIGMGTTNPTTAKLVIAGPAFSQGIDLSSSNVYANMRVLQNSNNTADKDMYFGFQSGPISSLHLYSNNGETMTIANGRVGIGFSDPHAQLHLTNQIANRRIVLWEAVNNDHQFAGFGVNSNILRYQVEGTNGNHIFYAAASATSSNELMCIQGDGRVRIGSAAATGYLLTVGGKIICTELKVQVQPFPDYVFEDDYNLKSIDELEQHIKTYNRLPGMPSACEVEENGMNVGDMQTKVVEKVEENALYIIQLKKEIDALKAQLDALQK